MHQARKGSNPNTILFYSSFIKDGHCNTDWRMPLTAAVFCYYAWTLANNKDGRVSSVVFIKVLFVCLFVCLFVYAILRRAILGFLIYVACCTPSVSCMFSIEELWNELIAGRSCCSISMYYLQYCQIDCDKEIGFRWLLRNFLGTVCLRSCLHNQQ